MDIASDDDVHDPTHGLIDRPHRQVGADFSDHDAPCKDRGIASDGRHSEDHGEEWVRPVVIRTALRSVNTTTWTGHGDERVRLEELLNVLASGPSRTQLKLESAPLVFKDKIFK